MKTKILFKNGTILLINNVKKIINFNNHNNSNIFFIFKKNSKNKKECYMNLTFDAFFINCKIFFLL